MQVFCHRQVVWWHLDCYINIYKYVFGQVHAVSGYSGGGKAIKN